MTWHASTLSELHANEYLLLAYYIAAVNIETTFESPLLQVFAQMIPAETAQAKPHISRFPGIVFTDTFQLQEVGNRLPLDVFPRNSQRAQRQLGLSDIRVVIGNPPWSIGQRSQNDNNPNQSYPTLDLAIAKTICRWRTSGAVPAAYTTPTHALCTLGIKSRAGVAERWSRRDSSPTADSSTV